MGGVLKQPSTRCAGANAPPLHWQCVCGVVWLVVHVLVPCVRKVHSQTKNHHNKKYKDVAYKRKSR